MKLSNLNTDFAQEVREKSGQPIELCFQCQKCASGCPMGESTDYYPNQVIRMIQFGMVDKILQSTAIWLCLSCEACSVRCPNGIKIPEVMDVLREMAFKKKITAKGKNAPIFHHIFLNSIKKRGRVHEASMMIEYKIKSGDLFSDMATGLKMLQKGKLPLVMKSIKRKKEIKKIFNKVMQVK